MRCVIDTCNDPADTTRAVEMAIPERPYKELRSACPTHLERFRNIGLPVRNVPAHGGRQ